jgi:hypothetical protein
LLLYYNKIIIQLSERSEPSEASLFDEVAARRTLVAQPLFSRGEKTLLYIMKAIDWIVIIIGLIICVASLIAAFYTNKTILFSIISAVLFFAVAYFAVHVNIIDNKFKA